jgi:ketosteroid isomerase-like protein
VGADVRVGDRSAQEEHMIGANEERVRDFIDAMRRRDHARVGELFSDDIRWWIPPSGADRRGLDVPLRGRDAVIEMIRTGQSAFEEVEMEIEFMISGDQGAAAVVQIAGRLVSGGTYGPRQYGWFFRFNCDGQIAELWEFTDTAAAFLERGL